MSEVCNQFKKGDRILLKTRQGEFPHLCVADMSEENSLMLWAYHPEKDCAISWHGLLLTETSYFKHPHLKDYLMTMNGEIFKFIEE